MHENEKHWAKRSRGGHPKFVYVHLSLVPTIQLVFIEWQNTICRPLSVPLIKYIWVHVGGGGEAWFARHMLLCV